MNNQSMFYTKILVYIPTTSLEKCHEFTVASLLTPAARNFIFPKHRATRQTTFKNSNAMAFKMLRKCLCNLP